MTRATCLTGASNAFEISVQGTSNLTLTNLIAIRQTFRTWAYQLACLFFNYLSFRKNVKIMRKTSSSFHKKIAVFCQCLYSFNVRYFLSLIFFLGIFTLDKLKVLLLKNDFIVYKWVWNLVLFVIWLILLYLLYMTFLDSKRV